MLIICSECGKEYSDQSEHCIHCGAKTSQNRYISNNVTRRNNPYQNNINGSGCSSVLMLIIALILCFVGFKLLFGALGLLGLDKDTITSTFKNIWEEDSFWNNNSSSNSSSLSTNKVYNIGETITTNKFEITVTNVEEKPTVGTSTSAGEGNTFVCISIKIKNICGQKIGILSTPTFHLIDGKNINYYTDFLPTLNYLVEIGAGNQPDLYPGVTIYDVAVFTIDKRYYTQNTFTLSIWADEIIKVKIK